MAPNRKIITQSGEIMPLAVWQQTKFSNKKGYDLTKISNFFSTKERSFNKENWLLHESLFDILDLLRSKVNKPIRINSAYRTEAEQRTLRKTNAGAVSNSPHCWGLAVDIDTENWEETKYFVVLLKEICKDLNLKVRLGYNQYKSYASFVHLDLCPEVFGEGKIWEHLPNVPDAFRNQIEW